MVFYAGYFARNILLYIYRTWTKGEIINTPSTEWLATFMFHHQSHHYKDNKTPYVDTIYTASHGQEDDTLDVGVVVYLHHINFISHDMLIEFLNEVWEYVNDNTDKNEVLRLIISKSSKF